MNNTNSEDFAFPVHSESIEFGLTKLEYFAAFALQGLLANPDFRNIVKKYSGSLPDIAVQYADDLIEELNMRNAIPSELLE